MQVNKVYKDEGRAIVVSVDGKQQVTLGWGKGYPQVELPKSSADQSVMQPAQGETDPHSPDLLEDAPQP